MPNSDPSALNSPTPRLFREQAVEQFNNRRYGAVLLTRPLSYAILTGIFSALALALLAFVFLFETTRKAPGQGVLAPATGVVRVYSTQAGLITQVHVREGQYVRAGQVLFSATAERASAFAGSTEQFISRQLDSRRDSYQGERLQIAAQTQQRMKATEDRARDIRADIVRSTEQIALQERRMALAEQAVQRFTELKAANYVSDAQLQERNGDVLDQKLRLTELHRLRSTGQRELANAQAELSALKLQAKRDSSVLDRNLMTLEQDIAENAARIQILVRAPQAGTIAAVTGIVGQVAAPGTALAAILPAGTELEAEIYAPSRSIGFVRPGMTVLLRYQAYPYQKFGQHLAYVKEIANTALRADELGLPSASPGAAGEPLYRIRLTLNKQSILAYGKVMPLKSGMVVDASIVLDKRKLYEWILDPVLSITGRI